MSNQKHPRIGYKHFIKLNLTNLYSRHLDFPLPRSHAHDGRHGDGFQLFAK
jgi:hypothetical protein